MKAWRDDVKGSWVVAVSPSCNFFSFVFFYRSFGDDEHRLLAGERHVWVGLHERLDSGQREFGQPAVGRGGGGACLLLAALLLRLGPAALLFAPTPVWVMFRRGDRSSHCGCHSLLFFSFFTQALFPKNPHTNHYGFLATCHTWQQH